MTIRDINAAKFGEFKKLLEEHVRLGKVSKERARSLIETARKNYMNCTAERDIQSGKLEWQ